MNAGPESKDDTHFEDTQQRWAALASAFFSTGRTPLTNTQLVEPTADRADPLRASASTFLRRGYVTVTEFFSKNYAAAVPLQMRYLRIRRRAGVTWPFTRR